MSCTLPGGTGADHLRIVGSGLRKDGTGLDQTDRRILAILERNARTSVAEIGRRIGLSRPAVQERIAKLEESGVIAGYRAELGPAAGDLIRAVLFVEIAVRPCDPALGWLAALEGVEDVASLSGDVDALVRVVVPDLGALTRLNDRIGASDLIASSRSSVVLRQLR